MSFWDQAIQKFFPIMQNDGKDNSNKNNTNTNNSSIRSRLCSHYSFNGSNDNNYVNNDVDSTSFLSLSSSIMISRTNNSNTDKTYSSFKWETQFEKGMLELFFFPTTAVVHQQQSNSYNNNTTTSDCECYSSISYRFVDDNTICTGGSRTTTDHTFRKAIDNNDKSNNSSNLKRSPFPNTYQRMQQLCAQHKERKKRHSKKLNTKRSKTEAATSKQSHNQIEENNSSIKTKNAADNDDDDDNLHQTDIMTSSSRSSSTSSSSSSSSSLAAMTTDDDDIELEEQLMKRFGIVSKMTTNRHESQRCTSKSNDDSTTAGRSRLSYYTKAKLKLEQEKRKSKKLSLRQHQQQQQQNKNQDQDEDQNSEPSNSPIRSTTSSHDWIRKRRLSRVPSEICTCSLML